MPKQTVLAQKKQDWFLSALGECAGLIELLAVKKQEMHVVVATAVNPSAANPSAANPSASQD